MIFLVSLEEKESVQPLTLKISRRIPIIEVDFASINENTVNVIVMRITHL